MGSVTRLSRQNVQAFLCHLFPECFASSRCIQCLQGLQVINTEMLLMHCLHPMQVCDTTSELAAITLDSNAWPELLPFIFQLVQSEDMGERESSLLIFAQLAHYIMPTLTQYMGTLNTILHQCLSSSNTDVALAAMRATTAFIQELHSNQDRDKFQVHHHICIAAPSQGSVLDMEFPFYQP